MIEARVDPPKLGEELARILPKVHAYIADQDGEIAGRPFMRYLDMTDHFLIDAGVPTAKPMVAQDDILSRVLPGGKTATTLFLGEYHLVGAAWNAVFAWCKEQGIEQHYGGWDVYENDPGEVSDPGEIRTRLYHPLSR